VSRAVRHRYLAGLAAEGLFPLALDLAPAPRPVPVPPSPSAAEPLPATLPEAPVPPVPLEAVAVESIEVAEPAEPEPFDLAPLPEPEPAAPEPVHTPGEIFPLRSIGEAVEAELWRTPVEPEPEPEAAEVSEGATVTLGDLYLRQGHVGEAERIFKEVLRREPENTAARDALAQVASSWEEPAAAASAAAAEPAAVASDQRGDRRTRKVQLLTSYLQRIRRGSQPDVP
jgi:hypothetical protein